MSRKYGLKISENTVKAILKRNGIKKKQRRTGNGKVRDLYDYEYIEPFVEFQLDTKHLLDFKSLPKEVYEHMQRYKLPKCEWNLVDIGTRTRFTAYSYELNATYGYMFIVFCGLWLRAHNPYKAQRWQDTWNFSRHHLGKGMRGLTPNQKLKQSKSIINEHIQIFPTFLMENLFKFAGSYFNSIMLKSNSGGKYVYTTCPAVQILKTRELKSKFFRLACI